MLVLHIIQALLYQTVLSLQKYLMAYMLQKERM